MVEYKAGDIVTFGKYPTLADGTEKPVEWVVLSIDDGTALLLSRYGINNKPFDMEINFFRESFMNQWLNENFRSEAFDAWINKDVKQISLLSIGQVKQYLKTDEERRCRTTSYAKFMGAAVSEDGFAPWWTKNAGDNDGAAAFVSDTGEFDYVGQEVKTPCVVRPCVRVNANSKYILLDEEIKKERRASSKAHQTARNMEYALISGLMKQISPNISEEQEEDIKRGLMNDPALEDLLSSVVMEDDYEEKSIEEKESAIRDALLKNDVLSNALIKALSDGGVAYESTGMEYEETEKAAEEAEGSEAEEKTKETGAEEAEEAVADAVETVETVEEAAKEAEKAAEAVEAEEVTEAAEAAEEETTKAQVEAEAEAAVEAEEAVEVAVEAAEAETEAERAVETGEEPVKEEAPAPEEKAAEPAFQGLWDQAAPTRVRVAVSEPADFSGAFAEQKKAYADACAKLSELFNKEQEEGNMLALGMKLLGVRSAVTRIYDQYQQILTLIQTPGENKEQLKTCLLTLAKDCIMTSTELK